MFKNNCDFYKSRISSFAHFTESLPTNTVKDR